MIKHKDRLKIAQNVKFKVLFTTDMFKNTGAHYQMCTRHEYTVTQTLTHLHTYLHTHMHKHKYV